MPKRKAVIIVDGRKYEAEYIGKGQFSRVYRVGDRVIYYTRGDCAKEVLDLYTYEPMTHLPEMIRHDDLVTHRDRWNVYSSPYYRNVSTKDRSAWELYKKLQKYYDKEYRRLHYQGLRGYQAVEAFVVNMEEERKKLDIPYSIVRALFTLYELYRNCGDRIEFDFQKSNFGVNRYGTLIFRDIAYVKE